MANDVIIRVEDLWKRYGIPPARNVFQQFSRYVQSMTASGDTLVKSSRWSLEDTHGWALKGVSFEVRKGETFGIIGRNGSGKSTLLKILASTSPPTFGSLDVKGRIFSMIELGAGMNPELTGRENVRLLATIMGFSQVWITQKMSEVEAFCDIGEWFDKPVWQYSSGMTARLGFAVAVNADADVLLIDEVFAVGDVAFQKKCFTAMERLKRNGVSIVFVSHSVYQVERLCERTMLLDKGGIIDIGDSYAVFQRYMEMLASGENFLPSRERIAQNQRAGTGDLRVQRVEFIDKNGKSIDEIIAGEPVTIRLHYKVNETSIEPNFSIRFIDDLNVIVLSLNSTAEKKGKVFLKDGYLDCNLEGFPLMPKSYTIQIKVAGTTLIDLFQSANPIKVNMSRTHLVLTGNQGIAFAEAEWKFH